MSRQIPGLFIVEQEEKGRSVYTSIDIEEGDIIEIAPVIVLPEKDLPVIHKTHLHDYYFLWGENHKSCAIALGFGSIYNHATDPNAHYSLVMDEENIEFYALKKIPAGSEITINYNGEPGNDESLWFDEVD